MQSWLVVELAAVSSIHQQGAEPVARTCWQEACGLFRQWSRPSDGCQGKSQLDCGMTNVSQGGREDGLSPPGAADEKTRGVARIWTKDSVETESPGQSEGNKCVISNYCQKKCNFYHVDLILIQHISLWGNFLQPFMSLETYIFQKLLESKQTVSKMHVLHVFAIVICYFFSLCLSLVSLLDVWLNKQMQRKRCIIYETRLSPSWGKCKQVASN